MTPFLLGQSQPTEPALVWPWAANWQTPISERLEWRTATAGTQSGKEQRRALRRWPRLYFGFSSNITHTEVPRLLEALSSWRTGTWAVPAWWATAKLTANATDVLALDRATDTLWPSSGWALLWRSATDCEPVEVLTVGTDTLTLAAEPAGTWQASSVVVPLYFAVLGDSQNVSAPSAAVATIATLWSADPVLGNAVPEGGSWPLVFPGDADASDPRKALWWGQHNWAEQITLEVQQALDIFDPGSGGWSRRAASDLPAHQWGQRVLLVGDEQQAAMRRFAGAHRGAAVGFYAASPLVDVTIASVAGSDVTFATPIANVSGRYAGLLLDGVPYAVDTWSADGATLTSAPSGMPTSARLIEPARLASDALEITHHTRDVAEAALSIRTTPIPDPSADATVKLLLHFDGDLVDAVSGNSLTVGSATYGTGVFGQAASHSGNPGLVAPWTSGFTLSGLPWALEFRAKIPAGGGMTVLAKNYWPSEPAVGVQDFIFSISHIYDTGVTWGPGGTGATAGDYLTLPDDEWFAMAMTDDLITFRIYLDGAVVYSQPSISSSLPAGAGQITVFNALQGFSGPTPRWGGGSSNGQLDELRLIIGRAVRTTSTYAPDTSPWTYP